MTKTYTTNIYGTTVKPPTIGTQCWIVERVFGDYVAETLHQYKCPETNRGHQIDSGWMGSWNEESKYARGKCWLIAIEENYDYPNRIDYDDYGDPVLCGYTLIWSDEPPAIG
jgi:hypothetical protein